MPSNQPFSPACERNRDPILEVLRVRFASCAQVLEIGSGTGQHAVHFATAMPWLRWQCSDRAEHLPGMQSWLDAAALANTPPPLELDVSQRPWPRADRHDGRYDAVFSANTLHIMGWSDVEALFAGLDNILTDDATLVVYGPFNDDGRFDSDSNRAFDASLSARDPRMGLRDVEAVDALARNLGLQLQDRVAMPANNRCLVWTRNGRLRSDRSGKNASKRHLLVDGCDVGLPLVVTGAYRHDISQFG
ncbi:MAG: DUF938 domain-containing protein [Luteimonas sp.]